MRRTFASIVSVLVLSAALLPARAMAAPLYKCFESTAGAGVHTVGNVGSPVVDVPTGSPTAASSAQGPLSGVGSGGSGEGMLMIAVLAAAALPIVLYAVDSEAEEQVMFRHHCPSFDLQVVSGAMSLPSNQNGITGLAGVRATFGYAAIGFDLGYETTFVPGAYGSADAHFLLRPPPKKHVQGALALGVRRVVFGGAANDGIEIALPHRYVLTRAWGRPFAIEVDPGVLIGLRGVDYRLDAGLSIPAGVMNVRVGARIFSFDSYLRGGGYLGFNFGT